MCTPSSSAGRRLAWGLACFLLIGAYVLLLWQGARPFLLLPEAGADWIKSSEPQTLGVQRPIPKRVVFRAEMNAEALPGSVSASLRSLGRAELFVNGRLVAASRPWHGQLETLSVDLAPHLAPGRNEMQVSVASDRGPPALLVHSEALRLRTGASWTASADGRSWRPIALAREPEIRPRPFRRWSAPGQLGAHLAELTVLFAAGAGFALVAPALWRRRPGWLPLRAPLHLFRWILLTALAAVYAWNFRRAPLNLGMDVLDHIAYADQILRSGRLPLADEGWQTFQPPLAHLVGAALLSLGEVLPLGAPPALLLRLASMAWGLLALYCALRACELAFERPLPAAAAMTLAASLPVSLYMSHAFGNEPVAAALGAALLVQCMRILCEPHAAVSQRLPLWIGILGGLALLAKTSTAIAFLAAVALLVAQRRRTAGARSAVHAALTCAGVAAVVSGWYFVRNAIHFGRLVVFTGGWQPTGLTWWQYPGYRVPEHFLRFGESLLRPYLSGVDGFWDGLHSTLWLDGQISGLTRVDALPWEVGRMATLSLLALPVLAAVLAGAVRCLRSPRDPRLRAGRFCSLLLAASLGAIGWIYAQVPSFSAAKASYLLPVAPVCLPVLAVLGAEPWTRRKAGVAVASGYLALWSGVVLRSFLG